MPDALTTQQRSLHMAKIRSQGSKAEEALRHALRRAGRRPSTNAPKLPGKPDFAFHREKLAVFVDGELWHGAQWRRRRLDYLLQQFPPAKQPYWGPKLHRNIARDIERMGLLLRDGWRVLRFWETDVLADPDAAARRVLDAVEGKEKPIGAGAGSAADFFAGIGLTSRGLAGAGWATVWANDFSPDKRRLFLHNKPPRTRCHFEDRSVHDVPPRSLPSAELIAACFPCTDLSLAGARRGIEAGPQSSAYFRFVEILRAQRPRPPFVLLENVTALISSHAGRDFELCLRSLADLGYTVDAAVVDARHFVPQSRPRLFIVGVRKDLSFGDHDPFNTAEDLPKPTETRPKKLLDFVRAHPDLPWRLRPLPPLPERTLTLDEILDQYDPNSPEWWSDERVQKLLDQLHERHRAKLLDLAKRDVAHATGFRRMRQRDGRKQSTMELRFDGLAGCLRTPKGGSAKQVLVRAEGEHVRARYLSARECARLMGAPDFKLDAEGVSENDALFGFGDAVCVPAVTWLVQNAINPLAAELIRGKLLGDPGLFA